jgi:hypothetical protein
VYLKIVNFEKFNPRKDRIRHHWFRIENSIFISDTLFELEPDQKWFWIFLLAYVSQKQTDGVDLNLNVFSHLSGISKKRVEQTLELFLEKGLVTIESKCGNQSDTDRGLHNITEHNNTLHNITAEPPPSAELDLLSLYEIYPRKEGKAAGLKKLKTIVKTPEVYERVKFALDRFVKHHQTAGTEAKFIPFFSTWVNSWTDWEDPHTGSSTLKSNSDLSHLFAGIKDDAS